MTITSLLFFISALVAAFIFYWLPQKFKPLWLLCVSIGFLITWSWQFVVVLTVLSLINYWIGLHVYSGNPHKQPWLLSGIAFNILSLFIFKYSNFYLPSLQILLTSMGIPNTDGIQILIPVGLSFLVVQWISYLVDVSNNYLAAEKNIIRFLTYGFYFPRLLSGPVERARLFFPRLEKPLPVNRSLLERSAVLIITGLTRKLIFADPLFGLIPAEAFTSPTTYTAEQLFFWLLCYSFALYNDFAGYTLIIRGVSLWFGIELTNNFNLPYLSRNFSEFWSRWHISLSNWLRDYIFFPLSWSLLHSKSKHKGLINLVLPPMVTMLVSGLWHGLSWNMLVWGGLHGTFLIIDHLYSLVRPQPPLNERPRWRQLLGMGTTFLFTILAWVPFKMPLANAIAYWKGLFHWVKPNLFEYRMAILGKFPFPALTNVQIRNLILFSVLALAILFDLLQNRKNSETFVQQWPLWAQIVLIVILLAVILLASFANNVAPFVYQNF